MYNPEYLERPYVVVLNKIDLPEVCSFFLPPSLWFKYYLLISYYAVKDCPVHEAPIIVGAGEGYNYIYSVLTLAPQGEGLFMFTRTWDHLVTRILTLHQGSSSFLFSCNMQNLRCVTNMSGNYNFRQKTGFHH